MMGLQNMAAHGVSQAIPQEKALGGENWYHLTLGPNIKNHPSATA